MPGWGADCGVRSGAWCAFRLVPYFHFTPSAPAAPGIARAGAVCTHQMLQVAGPSGKQWEGEQEVKEEAVLVWSPQDSRLELSQHGADDHRDNPNQPLQSVTPSNTSESISITRSNSNLFLALCAQLKVARGTSGKWDRKRGEGWGEGGDWSISPDQTMVDGDERLE